MIRYGSVCSGIEAATVAWHDLGWQPAWFSEIEPFPCAVLAHHYPHVPNYGDMTKHQEWPNEPINLLVGGTPCQSFSVAGLRKGLDDPRGNLMLTYGAIAKRYRPEWLVWENVPGVLSSHHGRDFGTFLGMLAELGYGFAYRILDAQYFGVAQRRRRVFVVANARSWQRAAAVLFESHSLQGHPAPSREAGQEAAGTIAARFGNSRNNHEELAWPAEVASTLTAKFGSKMGLENQHALGGAQLFVPDVMGTLTARMMNALGAQDIESGAVLPVAFPWQSATDPIGKLENLCGTLIKNQTMAVAQPIAMQGTLIGRSEHAGPNGPGFDESGSMFTLTKTDVHAVAQPVAFKDTADCLTAAYGTKWNGNASADNGSLFAAQSIASSKTAGTLRANAGSGFRSNGTPVEGVAIQAMQVRRLTPVECERLQGFPDGYTNIPWRKKDESPDGPRYKALGNSMAVPVMRWIGERIAAVDEL